MDLPGIKTYLKPSNLEAVTSWNAGHTWLAGGTWLFSEPQPETEVLVDLAQLGWSELEVVETGLEIGATCPLVNLMNFSYPAQWPALRLFQEAMLALAASFKVINVATIGGNLCLALPVSTLAPVMVLLNATYEIHHPHQPPRFVPARGFQLGNRQTILQPGEVLRRVIIPDTYLTWNTQYLRFGNAATDPALAIVAGIYNPATDQLRLAIGASVVAPYLLEFDHAPDATELLAALRETIPDDRLVSDYRASIAYRRHLTEILAGRCIRHLITGTT